MEASIYTQAVRLSSTGGAVLVNAILLSGTVVPGMFLRVPMNGMLDLTVYIAEVTHLADDSLQLILDCDNDPESAELVIAFNFEDETLRVTEDGER